MADALDITVSPVEAEVLSGESLKVEVIVTNIDDEPIAVQAGRIPYSPIIYELLSPDDHRMIYGVSQRTYRMRRAGKRVPAPMKPVMKTLATGESVTYTEDLTKYAESGFAPGQYHLVAKYMLGRAFIASEPVDVWIVNPNIRNLSTVFCLLQGVMGTVFDHLNSDGSISLFQRETLTRDPENGVFWRRLNAPTSDPLDDLAISIHTNPLGEGRWFAWLQSGSVSAARGWGDMVTASVEPVAIELGDAKLVKPGIHLADGSGLFIVSGLSGGQPGIQQFIFSRQGAQGGNIIPLSQYQNEQILACYNPLENGQLYLAWARESVGTTGIYFCQYSMSSQEVTVPPELLYEGRPPLAAFEMQTLTGDGKAQVHALFGSGDGEMNYVRIQLDRQKQSVEERAFPAPSAEAKAWAISTADIDDPPVIARTDDSILWTQARKNAEWNVLTESTEEITHLHILASDRGGFWAGWVEPSFGIRYAQIPVGE